VKLGVFRKIEEEQNFGYPSKVVSFTTAFFCRGKVKVPIYNLRRDTYILTFYTVLRLNIQEATFSEKCFFKW
jgi:hypothetical protein